MEVSQESRSYLSARPWTRAALSIGSPALLGGLILFGWALLSTWLTFIFPTSFAPAWFLLVLGVGVVGAAGALVGLVGLLRHEGLLSLAASGICLLSMAPAVMVLGFGLVVALHLK